VANQSQARLYRASAVIAFPKVDQFLDPILSSIATHDITVVLQAEGYAILTPFGKASIAMQAGELHIAVETHDAHAFNRLKHTLVGPISFIAASEDLTIEWAGDEAGLTPMDDLRTLRVKTATMLTPCMRRVVFEGEDLARFDRADQLHCRLIFQPKNIAAPQWPALDDRGHVVWAGQRKLDTRVYTIRAIDVAKGELTIDFALHAQAGPATQWARAASVGDMVGIVGPAANGPKPAAFYVLAGDETGLPGIARILEGLDKDARGVAFIEIADVSAQQTIAHPPGIVVQWLHRDGMAPGTTLLLPEAVRSVVWPADLNQAFFWGGCEHKAFREIHRMLRHDIGLPRERQVLYSHWHRSLSEEQIIAEGAKAYLPE